MGNTHARPLENRNVSNRRSSILWNFRYPSTVRRREDLAVMVHNSRMSIVEWLELLELQQYEGNLQEFNVVDDVVDITDKELKQCGVRGAHRQKMVNSLLGVRAKRRQSMNLEAMSSAPRAVPLRKNSCPLVYLGESSPDVVGKGDSDSGPGVIITKSGKVLKQLTFDETATM